MHDRLTLAAGCMTPTDLAGVLRRLGHGADRRFVGFALLHLYRNRTPQLRPGQRVLFLCQGNVCRSAMAAAEARHVLERVGAEVSSAGLGSEVGRPVPELGLKAAGAMGLDLRGHRSVSIGADEIRRADCVLVMDRLNILRAWRRFPCVRRKMYLLDAPREVPDPYGRPEEAFRLAFDQIRRAIARLSVEMKGRR